MLFFVVGWIMLSVVVGIGAKTRGRDGGSWFLLSFVTSPFVAGLFLVVLPRKNQFTDIATLAMIEATPEGSRSRQLLAEHEAKSRQLEASRPLHKRYVGVGYCPVCKHKDCTGTLLRASQEIFG